MAMRIAQIQGAVLIGAAALLMLCATSSAQTSKPSDYPATTDGLTQYFKDMLIAADVNDQERLLTLCQSLLLPKPKEWFIETFGKDAGTPLAETYAKDMENFGEKLAVLFLRLDTPKDLKVTVVKVETPDDPRAKLVQTYVIEAMRKPYALYTVTIAKEGTTAGIGLWSIIYVDGSFRMAGKMLTIREATRGSRGIR